MIYCQFRCWLLTTVSTCFGHLYAHHQEKRPRVTAYGVYLLVVLDVPGCGTVVLRWGCDHYEGCCSTVETVVNNQHLQLTINHLHCCILLVFFLHALLTMHGHRNIKIHIRFMNLLKSAETLKGLLRLFRCQALKLLLWNVGWLRRAEGQVKWQARGLAAHNGESDHRPWVGVHSGLVMCDGVCHTGLPQTEVLAPTRSFFGTGQPSLFSWRFVHWSRSCCHYSEHKRNTLIF